jgi:hypothetical protein
METGESRIEAMSDERIQRDEIWKRAVVDGYKHLVLRDGNSSLALVQAVADVKTLLSLLDGKAPKISEAIEKVKALRAERQAEVGGDSDETDFAKEIITALESLQSTPVGKQRCVDELAQVAFDAVIAVENSPYRYSALQKAAQIAASIRAAAVGKEAGEQRESDVDAEREWIIKLIENKMVGEDFIKGYNASRLIDDIADNAHRALADSTSLAELDADTSPVPVAELEESTVEDFCEHGQLVDSEDCDDCATETAAGTQVVTAAPSVAEVEEKLLPYLQPDEIEELARLRREWNQSWTGDRPQSMASEKLERLIELEAMPPPVGSDTAGVAQGEEARRARIIAIVEAVAEAAAEIADRIWREAKVYPFRDSGQVLEQGREGAAKEIRDTILCLSDDEDRNAELFARVAALATPDTPSPVDHEKQAREGDDYVAWCRYTYDNSGSIKSIVTCDSDAKGAFKVYRAVSPNKLPDLSKGDSSRLREFERIASVEIRAVGGVGAATSLEMIGYMRELEHYITTALQAAAGVGGGEIESEG